ncbi:hypothetical protein ACVWZV_002209 [Bradyrhizobium sp. GM5.1]|jgi:hypothetical protein
MLTVIICERMGWDYRTYCAQPKWFVELIIAKYDIDGKKERQRQEQMKQ